MGSLLEQAGHLLVSLVPVDGDALPVRALGRWLVAEDLEELNWGIRSALELRGEEERESSILRAASRARMQARAERIFGWKTCRLLTCSQMEGPLEAGEIRVRSNADYR